MPIIGTSRNIAIGIFGSNGKTSTVNLLYSMFNSTGLAISIINDEKIVAHKRTMTNYDIYKQLKNAENSDIIIVEINENLLKNDYLKDVRFDILIHCHICDNSYEASPEGINKINSIINSYGGNKAIIINTDDPNWKSILIDAENSYLITYGLGNKATVTASSIECGKMVKFCYCLQRTIANLKGGMAEPMEVPIAVNIMGQYNVYNGLASITAAMICCMGIDDIIAGLKSVSPAGCGVRAVYENGFGVVDSVCRNSLSFETGFDAVQNLPYQNVHLIFNLSDGNSKEDDSKIIDIICSWSLILRIKKLYFIGGRDEELSLKHAYKLNSIPYSSQIEIISIGDAPNRIESIINSLMENDLLLFFCNRDLNVLRQKMIDMLDKRILGKFSGDIA